MTKLSGGLPKGEANGLDPGMVYCACSGCAACCPDGIPAGRVKCYTVRPRKRNAVLRARYGELCRWCARETGLFTEPAS